MADSDSGRQRLIESVPSTDLTDLARQGKLDPVIGRDQEIGRLVNILTRRTKNNPALVGEAGVGKTAAVEGLAQRIANGDVPERLRDKRVISIDLTGLIAGTALRGQFEEKLNNLIEEVLNAEGQVILFIDEMHLIMGAGAAGDNALDVANVLKPHLARGTVQCVGATTFSEYSKYIEKDPALARRFQKLVIAEPTAEDSVAILRGLRERFEAFHGIKVRDSALVAAANLTHRYLPERRLPDKAIDLVDETAARRRTEIDSMPPKLREMEERVARLALERDSLKKDNDDKSFERLKAVETELQKLQAEATEIRTQWEELVKAIHRRSELQSKLRYVKAEIERAQRRIDFVMVTYLEENHLRPLETELARDAEEETPNQFAIADEINADDIERQLAEWTGIPISRLGENDAQRLLLMEQELQSRVIGQERATTCVADAIRIARSGINDPNRPLATFLFLGPSGVGKTEVAKVLADTIFGDTSAFIRLDMSEYFDRYTVSRLIGAAPGYIGYDEGGQLTEAVRRKPFSCILFDELEKAHRDVYNILLQVLDEGRLTDARGRAVDFKNTIVIMTSNVGAELIADASQDDAPLARESAGISPQKVDTAAGGIDALPSGLRESLLKRFRPELLNRIDEIIVFSPLPEQALLSIVALQIRLLNERTGHRASVTLTDQAKKWLAHQAYSPAFGARPLRRLIRQHIEIPLSRHLLTETKGEQTIQFDLVKDRLSLSRR